MIRIRGDVFKVEPRSPHTVLGLALAAVLVAAVAAACDGGGEEASPVSTATQDASPVATATQQASPSPISEIGKIAYIDVDGNLALINPDGSEATVLTEGGGVAAFRWSPDGSLIAVEGGEGAGAAVRVLGVEGDLAFELPGASDPVWSPNGDRLVVTEGSGLGVYDLGGARVAEIADATGAAWSSDGATLAFMRPEGDADKGVPMLLDLAAGQESPLSGDIQAADLTFPIAWRPGGEMVAWGNAVYDLAAGEKVELPGLANSWSPDGRILVVTLEFQPTSDSTPAHLLYASEDFVPRIGLDVRVDPEGTPAWLYIKRWLAWSPDGRYLLYLDPRPSRTAARVYDTAEIAQDISFGVTGERPSVSSNGRHIVFMDGGNVWLGTLFDADQAPVLVQGSNPAWQPRG